MQHMTMVAGNGQRLCTPAPASTDAVVYIVEDDAAVRGAVHLLVEAHGWQARPLASPLDFLMRYDRLRPGCLVLDLRPAPPSLSAFDLQAIITNLALPVHVIVITADDSGTLAARARAAGALRVLAKPFREADLIAGIRIALDRLP